MQQWCQESSLPSSTFSTQTFPTLRTLPAASVCRIHATYTIPEPNTPFHPAFFPHLRAYWQSVLVTCVSLNPVSKHRCNVSLGSMRRSWAHKGMCELGIAPCMEERPLAESVQQSTELLKGGELENSQTLTEEEGTPSPQGSTTQRDRIVTRL